MAPPSFFHFHPLLLLLTLLLLQTVMASTLRFPKFPSAHRKQPSDFGGRDRNTTPPAPPINYNTYYKTYFYTQTFDHYNHMPQSYGTFKQRFLMSRQYFNPANNSYPPILVYFSSEGPLDTQYAGFLSEICRNFGALCVMIEQRFCGQSSPFKSIDEILQNDTTRGFFNPAQALADYAEIILFIKRTFHSPWSPTVVTGKGYGGMLASWFRLKYPHIAAAALASSAPVFFYDKSTPQDGYFRVISQDFRNVSENCYQTIRKSWAVIDKVASEPGGLFNLSQRFRTCSQLNKSSELKEFFESMYSFAAQFNDPPYYPVSMICEGIDDASKKTDDVLDSIFAGLVSYRRNQTCYDTDYYDPPSEAAVGWEWLACAEIMMHMGEGSNDTLFEGNRRFQMGRLKRRCVNTYNVSSTPRWLTTFYGGHDNMLNLKRFGSNIIFSNGLHDPYSAAGVLEDINDSIVALTTAKGSHALDLLAPADTDPNWLVEQRNREVNILRQWLATYNSDLNDYLKK